MTDRHTEFQKLFDAYVETYLAGDAPGCAAFYAKDGKIYSPFGPPIEGRKAIEEAHCEWFLEGETNKVITVKDARAEGLVGYCAAHYAADVPQNDGTFAKEAGTSVNTFERQADGHWKIRHTSLNTLDT